MATCNDGGGVSGADPSIQEFATARFAEYHQLQYQSTRNKKNRGRQSDDGPLNQWRRSTPPNERETCMEEEGEANVLYNRPRTDTHDPG